MKEMQFSSDYCCRSFNDDKVNGVLRCGFLTNASNAYSSDFFVNEYYSCSVLLHGQGTFIDSSGEKFVIVPNSIFQCFPDGKYAVIIDPDIEWYEFNVVIGGSIFEALISLDLLNTSKPVFQIDLKSYFIKWFTEFLHQLKNTEQAELAEPLFVSQKLLVNLHREDIRNYELNIDAIIAGAKEMLYYRHDENISLADVIASFNISYEKFRKLFKQEVGISPLQFRLQSKFLLAERLLTEGHPIKKVAVEVGYSDPFTFSRQFKKYIGCPPSSFKKQKSDDQF